MLADQVIVDSEICPIAIATIVKPRTRFGKLRQQAPLSRGGHSFGNDQRRSACYFAVASTELR
jgi:hypothetical protein